MNKNQDKLPTDFRFKKKFGQNFLTDTNLLRAICADAKIRENDCVLEIGTGAGALTTQLAEFADKGKVLSVEIDATLTDYLTQKFKSKENVDIIFGDILKLDKDVIKQKFNGKPFKVVANLPYYISSPILFYLVESDFNIESITVMLQRELVDRITASPNNKDYGAISVVLGLYGVLTKTRDVPRQLFTPQPDVDSAILSITLHNKEQDIKQISKVVKACFAMRRKTLVNNIIEGFKLNRVDATEIVKSCGFNENVRAENLSRDDYIVLTKKLEDKLNERKTD